MNENGLIRLNNLKRLGLTAAELSDRVGGIRSYWHGMLAGNRSFGEKAARHIEESLGLPRGSMDEDGSAQPVSLDQYKPSPYALALARMFDNLPQDEAVRATAFVNAQDAMRKAAQAVADPKSTPVVDAPAAVHPVKQ